MDLRWWADQERRGREEKGVPITRPGRPTLERRWVWSGRQARNILKEEHVWADPRHFRGDQDAASERPGSGQDAASERPAIDTQGVEIATQPASERTGSGQDAASERSGCGPTRVLNTRSTIHDPRIHSGSGDARAGKGGIDPTAANPSRLAEVWEEERQAMPPELMDKPVGLMAPWDLDLLEAGPVDAEEAIRALAELCRGTATRAPRRFVWSQLLGPGSRGLAGCWRDALAWKRGVGGEPAIGRAWRGGDGRNGAAGAGAGNGPARGRKGQAVIIGQGKHDPYDDGWGDAAPGEREAAEKAFAEWTAKQEAARAAGAVPPGGASR